MHLPTAFALVPFICLGATLQAGAQGRSLAVPRHLLASQGGLNRTPARWGAFTVTVDKSEDLIHSPQEPLRIRIRDRRRRVVREVDCGEYSAVYTQRIDAAGVSDLVIGAWDGSNIYCGHTTYIFTQNGGLRNVAIITGGEGRFERLGRHRLHFVLAHSGVLEYACQLCHACEPNLPVVLDWDNGRMTDVTAKYPALSEEAAVAYWKALARDCARWDSSKPGQSVISPAAGYYANEYELGRGRTAYRRVMHSLPTRRTRQWFHDCARVVRYQISQIRHMSAVSQDRVLNVPDADVFAHPPGHPQMDSLSGE